MPLFLALDQSEMIKDPHFEREAEKYEHPIPSRELILSLVLKEQQSFRQLVHALDISESQSKPLKKRLRAMVRDQELSLSKNGVYRKFSNRGLLKGTIIANPKGFGFVKLDKGGKDLRLNTQQMQLCFHGDEVRVRLLNDKFDAEIVEVLTLQTNLVGRLEVSTSGAKAIIDDKCISHHVAIDASANNYVDNDMVLIDIIKNPTANSLALGRITTKIGSFGDIDLEIKSALLRYDIPHIFDEQVMTELNAIADEVTTRDLKGRTDFTRYSFVTIDGDDSRDFDDAVYAQEEGDGYALKVAIADVGHYVTPNTALDECAKDRGNSVYFPRFVVPMLPKKLSNGLCSLNERVTRLALVCSMHINAFGEVTSYQFENGYICSHKRLTYSQVNDYFAGDTNLGSSEVTKNIDTLYQVYKLLKLNRQKLGLIEFERLESKIVFNDNGKIEKIAPYQRGKSHKLIEECMLIANKSAGDFLTEHGAKFLYRSHPKPDGEKLMTTRTFLKTFGLELGGGSDPTAKDFAKVLKAAKHKPENNVIKTLMLRSMSQAIYTPDIPYHFGLAFENYTHFTSPIRRYADLITHRAIKYILQNSQYHIESLGEIGQHISMTERRADDASRDSERWLKCEYMMTKVGQEYTGTISGVMGFGLFVELNELLVDGLVKIESLAGYYIYDATTISLHLRNGTKSYKLGDQVQVVIASVNLERREINLLMSS